MPMKALDKKFVNYAHRGASEYVPENTLMAFYLGLYMGANGIETDVQVTKDGIPVLFHDNTLMRMTEQNGSISDYTFLELLQFDAKKNGFTDKIVTLEDFLVHFAHRDLTFAIELKSIGSHRPTADLLRKYNMVDKTIVTSFKFDELKAFKEYAPEFSTGYLAEEVIDDNLLAKMKSVGIDELCPESKVISSKKVKEWMEKGFEVRAWGIYNEQIMKEVYHTGVNGMTVNFPDKLTEYILEQSK